MLWISIFNTVRHCQEHTWVDCLTGMAYVTLSAQINSYTEQIMADNGLFEIFIT